MRSWNAPSTNSNWLGHSICGNEKHRHDKLQSAVYLNTDLNQVFHKIKNKRTNFTKTLENSALSRVTLSRPWFYSFRRDFRFSLFRKFTDIWKGILRKKSVLAGCINTHIYSRLALHSSLNINEVIWECTTEKNKQNFSFPEFQKRWSKLHGNEEMCTRTRLAPSRKQAKRRNRAAKVFEF